MANNKNQHFVPRCYLRNFTVDGENKAINVFNVDKHRFIQGAPVKNQCSRDYFYGKDAKLERAIQSVESMYASVSREVMAEKGAVTERQKYALRTFWLFQNFRTEAASRRAVEMADELVTTIEAGSEFRLKISEAVQVAMHAFAENMDAVADLKVCVVKNKSAVPFVTSDDPAVLTNRWHFKDARRVGFSFGIQSCGVLAILPLSPTLLFIGYDGDVYSVPNKDGWVSIKNDKDADAFNQHQYLNCRANIFVKDFQSFPAIECGFESVAGKRLESKHEINYAAYAERVNNYERYEVIEAELVKNRQDVIIHSVRQYPQPLSWPSIIQWRHKGVVYSNGTGMGFIRKSRIDSSWLPFFKEPSFVR